MNSTLGNIGNYLVGWTLITLVLSWLFALTYPLLLRVLNTSGAQQASRATLIYVLLPPAAAILALLILSVPELAFPLVSTHCHETLCTPHTLHMSTDTLEGIVSVFSVVIVLTGLCTLIATQLIHSRKRLRVLRDLSEDNSPKYRLIDSPEHIAWCAGLLRPQIFISSGLLASLSAAQLRVVLIHEKTHAIRRDNLRKWLLYWATFTWPKNIRRNIRQNYSNYSEHICDLVAAQLEQKHHKLNDVIDTLASTDSIGLAPLTTNNHQRKRVTALQRELHLQNASSSSKNISRLLPEFLIAAIWLLSVITAVHFGHPLLEWLSS